MYYTFIFQQSLIRRHAFTKQVRLSHDRLRPTMSHDHVDKVLLLGSYYEL